MYETIQPPFSLNFRKMTPDELRNYFRWFLAAIPERVYQLQIAVTATPGFESWQADYSPESLDRLGEWFKQQVQTRPRTPEEIETIVEQSSFAISVPEQELTNRTFSLAIDLGMYLSQVLQRNHPQARWEQPLQDKEFADYGQPVLAGFGKVRLNPTRLAITLAYGIATGQQGGERLRELYDYWSGQSG